MIKITNSIIALGTLMSFALIFCNAYLEWDMLMIYNVCMGIEHNHTSHAVFHALFGGVQIFLNVSTMFFDIRCLLLVRRLSSQVVPGSNQVQQTERRHILNEVPMRSTLLNGVQMAIWFVFLPVVSNLEVSTQEKMILGVTLNLVCFCIKSPVIVFLTFRVNAENMRVNQDEERERKRQLEIQDAMRRRNARMENSRRNVVDPEGIIVIYGKSTNHLLHVQHFFRKYSKP